MKLGCFVGNLKCLMFKRDIYVLGFFIIFINALVDVEFCFSSKPKVAPNSRSTVQP